MRAYTIAVLAGLGIIGGSTVHAQAPQRPQFEYAAKFVCGRGDGARVAPGTFFTAINIHNPGTDTLRFRIKAAATDTGLRPGRISPFVGAVLTPDQAMEVECKDVERLLPFQGFQKGFVVIQAPGELDVVAVYTAADATRQVETMDVERVPARRMGLPSCPDLTVESIGDPVWDPVNKQSVITAIIRNVGTGSAGPSYARLEDPSTKQPSGAPYNSVAVTPSLGPGASASVTFTLPYWVFNPDADFHVTADYKGEIAECREDNNRLTFNRVG